MNLSQRNVLIFAAMFGVLLVGCAGSNGAVVPSASTLSPIDVSKIDIVTGQTVFVPAYSEIYGSNSGTLSGLNATLAIHNTDPDDAILIRSVRYYDTDGVLIRDFMTAPVSLPPMGTTGFVVRAGEVGGWGTNFIVEWGAEKPVYEPVIEAVMVGELGTNGISFISAGRVVSETGR